MPGILDWKPTNTPWRMGAEISGNPLSYVMAMREKFPEDLDLANLDHELFMEGRGIGGMVLPPLYYATKKVLQSHPSLERFGRRFTMGGLLEEPILDDKTTPASLNQMMHGIYGTLPEYFK